MRSGARGWIRKSRTGVSLRDQRPSRAAGAKTQRQHTRRGLRPMSWTDERVELLKKLWNQGLSASQIAGELGSVTRNAVIGKVHRLGLSGRAKSPAGASPR